MYIREENKKDYFKKDKKKYQCSRRAKTYDYKA